MRETLRNKRKELGLSQAEVARKANVTRQCYNYIENGQRTGTLPVLKKIAEILQINDIHLF